MSWGEGEGLKQTSVIGEDILIEANIVLKSVFFSGFIVKCMK